MSSRSTAFLGGLALFATSLSIVGTASAAHAATTHVSAESSEFSSQATSLARAAARVPAKPAGKCRQRQLNPRKPVPSKLFASCVVTGMKRGGTVTLTTRNTPGVTSSGPARFTNRTDASVKYSDGVRLVMLNGKGWYKPAGKGWVRPGKATEDQSLASLVVAMWNATSSDKAYQKPLRASRGGWKATGGLRKVNGVQAREYRGNVTFGGATFSRYSVWLDKLDRPIRIQTTGSAYGVTVKTRQDFKGWGKKVVIKPPKMR